MIDMQNKVFMFWHFNLMPMANTQQFAVFVCKLEHARMYLMTVGKSLL